MSLLQDLTILKLFDEYIYPYIHIWPLRVLEESSPLKIIKTMTAAQQPKERSEVTRTRNWPKNGKKPLEFGHNFSATFWQFLRPANSDLSLDVGLWSWFESASFEYPQLLLSINLYIHLFFSWKSLIIITSIIVNITFSKITQFDYNLLTPARTEEPCSEEGLKWWGRFRRISRINVVNFIGLDNYSLAKP